MNHAEYMKLWRRANPERAKQVNRDYYARNREVLIARSKKYYAANKDKRAVMTALWRANNREKKKADNARWAKLNPAKDSQAKAKYREANREKLAAYNRLWRQRNKALSAEQVMRRIARKKKAMPKWVDAKAIVAFYTMAHRRSVETGIPHQVDHIVPLAGRTVCGLHVPWNLAVIPRCENQRKSNKLMEV